MKYGPFTNEELVGDGRTHRGRGGRGEELRRDHLQPASAANLRLGQLTRSGLPDDAGQVVEPRESWDDSRKLSGLRDRCAEIEQL